MLEAKHIPYITGIQTRAGGHGLSIDKALTDGTNHYLEVSYVPRFPTPYSVSVISPIRDGLFDHEVFVGKKIAGVIFSSTWAVWMPALYSSLEVRIGTGPLEFSIDRLKLDNLQRGTIPPNPVRVPSIYMKESNVPKLFPDELKRFAPSQHLPKPGVCFDYWNVKEWNSAYYYCFSVVNDLPLPNISYEIKATCDTEEGQEIDRQFSFSRDEIIAITPCRPTKFVLTLITLPQLALGKLGFEEPAGFGPVADKISL